MSMEEPSDNSQVNSEGLIPMPESMKPLDPSSKRSLDEQQCEDEPDQKVPRTENRKIYVGNLPPSVTEKPLVAYFRTFGHIVNCSVVRDRDTGISRGFAFLTFLDDTEADAAVEYQQHLLDGKPIRVSYAQKGIVPQARKINEASIMDNVVRSIFIIKLDLHTD